MEKYLTTELGEEFGRTIYQKTQLRLKKLIENTKQKSESQMKLLVNTILPRIALYQVLLEEKEEDALEILKTYMCEVVGEKMHVKYSKMEKIPFFYSIYSRIFMAYTKKNDAWVCKVSSKDNSHFSLDIHKCLWHDACVENGCPELCQCFCMCDDVTYGGLRKIGFKRSQTLGTGGNMCDFTFFKK